MIMKNGKVEHSVRLLLGKGVGVTRSIEHRILALVPRNILGFQFQTVVSGEVEVAGQALAVSSQAENSRSDWYYVDAQVADMLAELPEEARAALSSFKGLNISFSSLVKLSDGSYTEHDESDKFVSASDLAPADPELDQISASSGGQSALLIAFMRSSER
jgi:hypothetical protein